MTRIRIAQYLCLFPGIFLMVSGLFILFSPPLASVLFDIKDIDMLTGSMARAMGIRQLAIGVMIVLLVLFNQTKALGIILLIGAIVPLADFIIFGSSSGWISALRHAAPVPLILGLGIYLLYQRRN